MSDPSPPSLGATGGLLRRWVWGHGVLVAIVVVVAAAAVALHRDGLSWGDDYTLYLRQARSLFDGNIGQVIADNHFDVQNAAKPGFSPYVYPWGWPLLAAPFVRWWGLDPARLKLVEVACLCGFVVSFHAVVRRRTSPVVALATVAVFGTTLTYLRHTDQLLSELPYMLLVGATLWWLDRCRRNGPLDAASRDELVALGLLAVALFNTRREGIAIVVAIAATQVAECAGRWRATAADPARRRSLATPHVVFVIGVIGFQLVLPSALAPHYDGAGLAQTWSKLHGSFRVAFGDQLGLPGLRGVALLAIFALVVVGVVLRLARRAADDVAIVVFAVLSMTIAGSIPAVSDRYLMAVTPFALYFAVQGVVELHARWGRWVAVALLVVLAVVHVGQLVGPMRDVRRANDSGVVQDGPLAPDAVAALDAVRHHTHQDDVVAFFKARAMTFFTDRRAVQSSDLQVVRERADYFLARRDSDFSQPRVSAAQAAAMGWTAVWVNAEWTLWELPRPGGSANMART